MTKDVPTILKIAALLPASVLIWLLSLTFRARFAEALFYAYLFVALAVGIVGLYFVHLFGRRSVLYVFGDALGKQRRGLKKAEYILKSTLRYSTILLGWPSFALTFRRYLQRLKSVGPVESAMEQITSASYLVEEAVLWMPLFTFALCFVFFLFTRHPAGVSSYVDRFYVLLLLAVLVRQLTVILESGKLIVLLRKMPGFHVLSFALIVLSDAGTAVIANAAIRRRSVSDRISFSDVTATGQLLATPRSLGRLLVPNFQHGFMLRAWTSPRADKIAIVSGLMMYVVALQSAYSIWEQAKRTDEDKIAAAQFLSFRGCFKEAFEMLSKVTTITAAREEARTHVELALGHPRKAFSACRRYLEETSGMEQDEVSDSEVYFTLIKLLRLPLMPSETSLILWQWGLKNKISSEVLLYHATEIFISVKDTTTLASFFPLEAEQTVSIATAFYYLFCQRTDDVLRLVNTPTFEHSNEALASCMCYFGARIQCCPLDERRAFADSLPEQWKRYISSVNQQSKTGTLWRLFLATSLNGLFAKWMRELGSKNEVWADGEFKALVNTSAQKLTGTDDDSVSKSIIEIAMRAAKQS